MQINPCHKSSLVTIIIFILGLVSFLFAQEELSLDNPDNPSFQEEKGLSELERQARIYRAEGFKLQSAGDIDAAMGLYQKAVALDPMYAAVYNDLGVIYEAKDILDKAELYYLTALKLDPNLLSGYSNLALLYESKRELEKAAYYWEKRADEGALDDPWTKKARRRLEDIKLVLLNLPIGEFNEEPHDISKDEAIQNALVMHDNQANSRKNFQKAKASYNRRDYANALKEALDAQQLDPTNKDIEKFIEKVQLQALSR